MFLFIQTLFNKQLVASLFDYGPHLDLAYPILLFFFKVDEKWYLLAPEFLADLDVCQDHQAQRGKIGDNKETGMVDLRVDFICHKRKQPHTHTQTHKQVPNNNKKTYRLCLCVPNKNTKSFKFL